MMMYNLMMRRILVSKCWELTAKRRNNRVHYYFQHSLERYSSNSNSNNNSSSNTESSSSFQFPEPTWSIEDLGLSNQHEPVSEQELQILARRALIDLDLLDRSTKSQLRQDLGNMMNMIEQVKLFPFDDEDVKMTTPLDDYAIYDQPRGISEAPLRNDDDDDDGDAKQKKSASTKQMDEMAKKVFDTYLKPKTTQVGAHNYFKIVTKRE